MIEGREVVSARGVVAANPPPAARIGARVLEAGGNAMDAAVAASLACCMLRPNQTGVGGYVCAALVRDAQRGHVWSIDANGVAPAGAHERVFDLEPLRNGASDAWLNELEYSCSVKDDANVYGPLSVTVPGMMAGMGIVHERWGRLKWAEVVTPSIDLLARGFAYEETAGAIAMREATLRRFPASVQHLMPGGKAPSPTDVWHRPDMEKTLARVAAAGWRDFYEGRIGREIADHIQSLGGVLTRQDMAAYQPRVTAPYCTTYRGARAHGAILPNGCISCLQALNMLECLDLPVEDSPLYWHLLIEVMKLVWRDRLRYLADPGFTAVPINRLLSKEYAAGRVEAVRQFPGHVDKRVPAPLPGGPDGTLHVSAADSQGNLAAMTISQGNSFGSCVTVPGTGIIIGHGMCRLDPRAGMANSVAPGKRPLNNTAAMIVETPDRAVAMGLPGGRKIISVMARAVQALVDRGWTGAQAAGAMRMHVEMKEPVEMLEGADPALLAALAAMGHQINPIDGICGVMNCAEFLRGSGLTRGGSSLSAAGAE